MTVLDNERPTIPPEAPADSSRGEFASAHAAAQTHAGKVIVLLGELAAEVTSLGAALVRLGRAAGGVQWKD